MKKPSVGRMQPNAAILVLTPKTLIAVVPKIRGKTIPTMSSAVEKILAVLPELTDLSEALMTEERGEEIKTQLKEMSWKCAEGSTSYQASLEASQQHLKEVKETMETAKDAERQLLVDLESKVAALVKAQEELTSVQREHQLLKDASRDEMNLGNELRESKEANVLIQEKIFPCLLNGTWTTEEEKVEKLQELQNYLQSIGVEKTLVAAVDGLITRPEERGDFDKMAIECITEELLQKLQSLNEELLKRQPMEQRREAELLGLQALVEISEQKQQTAGVEHEEVDNKVKEQSKAMRVYKMHLGKHTKAVEKFTELLRNEEAQVAQIQQALKAVDELIDISKAAQTSMEAAGTPVAAYGGSNHPGPVDPTIQEDVKIAEMEDQTKISTTEEPQEPLAKRARTSEAQVASPARVRC